MTTSNAIKNGNKLTFPLQNHEHCTVIEERRIFHYEMVKLFWVLFRNCPLMFLDGNSYLRLCVEQSEVSVMRRDGTRGTARHATNTHTHTHTHTHRVTSR